nr:hypothetical protein [uncultured Carboxylicivirga sp.]
MKISIVFLIVFFGLFSSCNNKLITKKISDENIELKWYHYSYITSSSDDFIEVYRGKLSIIITKLPETYIKDVRITNDTIYVNHLILNEILSSDVLLSGDVLGYKVVYNAIND